MNRGLYYKIIVPLEYWKKGIYSSKDTERLQLYPDWNWGFSIMSYGRKYDIGYFLKTPSHNYEDIYLTWKYIQWMPNFEHVCINTKNMIVQNICTVFLVVQICKQNKIPSVLEKVIKKFLV